MNLISKADLTLKTRQDNKLWLSLFSPVFMFVRFRRCPVQTHTARVWYINGKENTHPLVYVNTGFFVNIDF